MTSGGEGSIRVPDFPVTPFAALLNLFSNNCNLTKKDSFLTVAIFSILFVTFYVCMVLTTVKISKLYNISENYTTSNDIKKNIDISYAIIVTIAVFLVFEILIGINYAENQIANNTMKFLYNIVCVVGLGALVLYLLIGQFILKWAKFDYEDENEGDQRIKENIQDGILSFIIGIISTICYSIMIFIPSGKSTTTSIDPAVAIANSTNL